MRVLQVMAGGWYGGAERFFEDLVEGLARIGIDQPCVLRPFENRVAALEARGSRVSTVRFGGPLDLVSPCHLRRVAAAEKPDIVMGWMNRACRILPKGPWVNVGRLGGYYDLKYYRRCRYLICNTPDILAHVVRQGWPPERAYYIPNFCPVEEAAPVDRATLATPPDAKVLLILARLEEFKGIDVAIKALPDIPNAVLWIAGEGALGAALLQLASDHGVAARVRLLGWREDRAALLRAADVCIVPSRHEPFGNVVVNAWAYETPLVAAASQGPAFLVRDGEDGLLVPIGDAPALADAVNALLNDPAQGRRLTAGGRRRVEAEFSEASVVNQYYDVFQAIYR